jgi:glycosyltransferase involved in cell wall biosynthesis
MKRFIAVAIKNPALCHDWLNGMRGGEKCLEVFCELFPQAPVYTLFYEPGKISTTIASHSIHTSFLQNIPGVFKRYRFFLPLFPKAVEGFNFKAHDLVISTSHCVAKAARRQKPGKHLCYCFTPMRYAWGFFDEYFGDMNPVVRRLIRLFLEMLKRWDAKTVDRVDEFVAISGHVQKRIETFYGRQARVIYPPVNTDFFTPDRNIPEEGFYLVVSALVPYKRVDLAIQAFNQSGRPLVVIGDGPERRRLENGARGNITFLGWQPDEILRDYYRRCRALIFPGEEDFGIVPVEAQSCGRFVIAYGKGGALETVKDGVTGVFFDQLKPRPLLDAIDRFESRTWEGLRARENALRFSRERFKKEVEILINQMMASAINS